MTDIPTPDPAAAPSVPPRVRSIAYFVGLCAAAAGGTAISITAVVASDRVGIVAGIVGAVLTGIGVISNGLGVAFRPTTGLFR